MKANKDNIWSVPVYLPYLQQEITDRIIEDAEQKIGFKLPREYLDLLRRQNGGYIRFSLPELPHCLISGIGLNFPSLTHFDWDDVREYVDFQLDGLVPFDGDGHWHLCLDYRNNAKIPKVAYIDIECNEQSEIAGSFSEYLDLLEIEITGQYVMEGIASINELLSRLSELLKIKFEPPDTWTSGYEIHRAGLKIDKKQEWIWISPNDVNRGFIREEHPDYNKLKNSLPGLDKRFQNLPENAYIIDTTGGIRESVNGAIIKLGYNVKKMEEYYAP